jgi:DNA-binding NarL/FixJ family response regulator
MAGPARPAGGSTNPFSCRPTKPRRQRTGSRQQAREEVLPVAKQTKNGGGRAATGQDGSVLSKSLTSLTRRELEVLALVAHGESTNTIADQLAISPATVKQHRTNTYRKLGATNRIEAVRWYLLATRNEPGTEADVSV